MTEHQNDSNNMQTEKTKRSKYPGVIILTALLILITLTVFSVVNNQLAARSTLTAYAEENSPSFKRGSCCSIGSGNTADPYSQLGQAALEYYGVAGGDINGLLAYVEDFGCHQEVSLVRDNTLIKKYAYNGVNFSDITP